MIHHPQVDSGVTMYLIASEHHEMMIDEIDWKRWNPQERATLVFIVRGDQILLIHKKRGLGAGKINGPGVRLDPGETPLQCAVREVQEELCVTPTGLRPSGELRFQFVDGLSIHGYVFRAGGCNGEPQETEEARPIWVKLTAIPYEQMWADDRLWLPLMISNTPFDGRFVFDGDRMLDHTIETTR